MMTEELFDALCKQIPNLLEHYTKDEVFEIMKDVETKADDVAEDFMSEVWEEPMRRCDVSSRLSMMY